jgi:hypothetical protein
MKKEDAASTRAPILFLVGGGLSMIPSPSLGVILFGFAGILEWRLLCKKKWPWMQRLQQRQYVRIGGYIAISVLSLSLAIYTYLHSRKPTSPPSKANTQYNIGDNNTNINDANTVIVNPPAKPSPESELSGVLVPANEPDPFDISSGPSPDFRKYFPDYNARVVPPADALKVFLGRNVAWIKKIGTSKVLRIGGKDIITMNGTPDGLYVSANIWRKDGRSVAEIKDNNYTSNPRNYQRPRRLDPHEIQFLDKSGELMLKVRYINENAVVFQGTFYVPGHLPVIATEDMVTCGQSSFTGSIAGETRDCAWVFE